MELDVHLTRGGDEAWGFRLIGGVDFKMPLTVVKVLPNSPAERAGLQNGDTVSRIGDTVATNMSHDDSRQAVAVATDSLELGVTRGLYDPVLDDQEPIFVPIDQDDFDQPSLPTEVQFQQDYIDLTLNGLPEFLETSKLSESRSLTASPFVLPTKPYRPFSTEPITEIPPLEDPIILNPDFSDVFNKLGIDEDSLPKTRFKLPVSAQYDPDGKGIQFKKAVTVTDIEKSEMRDERMTKEEVTFMEKMKKDIDLDKIEWTATSIVDESIERALSVAQEIKKEIDIEIRESSLSRSDVKDSNYKSESVKETSKTSTEIAQSTQESVSLKSKETSKEVSELVTLLDKTTEELLSQQTESKDVNVAKKVDNFSYEQKIANDRRLSTRQDLEETIESGSVKRKSVAYDKEAENKFIEEKKVETKKWVDESQKVEKKAIMQKDVQQKETNEEKVQMSHKSEDSKSTSGTKMSTTKLLAEQRAYTIGLQTIPHIRGTIHSSYHYDLLLKTFFIHLTDVMVALSRFILSEPVLSKPDEQAEKTVINKETTTETVSKKQEVKNYEASEVIAATQVKEQKIEKQVTEAIHENRSEVIKDKKAEDFKKEFIHEEKSAETAEVIEKRALSGVKMAQLTEKKSEALTQNMEAVITEFESKVGIEETDAVRERRSRSRSRLEEEVSHESDPKENAKKSEQTIQVTTSNDFSSKTSESTTKRVESIHETKSSKSSKSKEGKKYYVAVVESHVYTNKDAILEEQLMSETSSVQSPDEVNVALLGSEAFSTEKVAIESLKAKEEVAKSTVEQTQESVQIGEVSKTTIIEQNESVAIAEKIAEKKQETVREFIEPLLEIQEVKSKIIEEKSLGIQDNVLIEERASIVQEEKKQETVAIEEVQSEHIFLAKQDTTDIAIEKSTEIISEEKSSVDIKDESMKITEQSKTVSFKQEQDEFADLKVIKEEVKEVSQSVEISEDTQMSTSQLTEIAATETKSYQSFQSKTDADIQESSFVAKSVITNSRSEEIQQSAFTAVESSKSEQIQESFIASQSYNKDNLKLALSTENAEQKKLDSQTSVQSAESTDINTPTPSTVPPTPLTDEYIFKLQMPMPKSRSTSPIPRDCTPSDSDDEDPHIVKKKLVPHIDTTLEEPIVYDPPLPTPPASKVTLPVYTKPGLRGGGDRREYSKEEILEIERKSSLLASAIDQTIKSIEEYKEEVGIDTKTNTTETSNSSESSAVIYNGYAKVIETKVYNTEEVPSNKMDEKWSQVEKQDSKNTVEVNDNPQNTDLSVKVEPKVEFDTQANKEVVTGKPENPFEATIPLNMENGDKRAPMEGYRPVQFNVEEIQDIKRNLQSIHRAPVHRDSLGSQERQLYRTETGEVLGTHQGIVDGLEEAVVDDEVAKEMGKPGMTEDKIAELISGESEMLREAHVMGLSRVITSHMHRTTDDSSVDFKKIKPILDSLKDSEVLRALNDELIKTKEEKKKEERKWTKFLQKPKRPVPNARFGYHGYAEVDDDDQPSYKVKIVKQPKPKVAPDYKPEDFETGLLPWEERALREPTPPPVAPEDPILVPEEPPEVLEAVDPLPESEIPDLEDSGIQLPSPKPDSPEPIEETPEDREEEVLDLDAVVEETEKIVEENLVEEMDSNTVAEKLMMSVQNMVDPNATLEQQLVQMRAQLAALAQLPCVIQQSLELVTRQLSQMSQMESSQMVTHHTETITEVNEENEAENNCAAIEEVTEEQNGTEENTTEVVEEPREMKPTLTSEELERMRREEEEMLEEQRRIEKQKKELMEQLRLEQESRQVKQRPTPRVGKPKPVFGPATPQARPLVLPGGRRWRKPQDAYNEQFIAETLTAQAELIQGKTKGLSYESVLLPYDERVNFLKYEKPPVSLDHLQNSDTYKLVHDMDQMPRRRVDMLTPVIAECDYREKCRSITPCTMRMNNEEHLDFPQQVQP